MQLFSRLFFHYLFQSTVHDLLVKYIRSICVLFLFLHQLNAKIGGILLWENPNPKVAFGAQTINLSSSDFDFYDLYWATAINNNYISVNRSLKGHGTTLVTANADKTASRRQIDGSLVTQLKVSDGVGIPIKIIGYKS